MSQNDEIRKRREQIETQLKDVSCDMSTIGFVIVQNVVCFLTLSSNSVYAINEANVLVAILLTVALSVHTQEPSSKQFIVC